MVSTGKVNANKTKELATMNATLTITGNLDDLAAAATMLSDHFARLNTTVEPAEFGGWSVEAMRTLLRRLAPKQLALVQLVSTRGGYTADDEVRAQLGNESGGMKGLTGPISKHINALIDAGIVSPEASFVVKTERDPENRSSAAGFVMPPALAPVVIAALENL